MVGSFISSGTNSVIANWLVTSDSIVGTVDKIFIILKMNMNACRGVVKDSHKQSGLLNVRISNNLAELMALKAENFVSDVLMESSELRNDDKRKIVTLEAIQQLLKENGLDILHPLIE